jgi:hypothetical protein
VLPCAALDSPVGRFQEVEMMSFVRSVALVVSAVVVGVVGQVGAQGVVDVTASWWDVQEPEPMDVEGLGSLPSTIAVSGNRFVDEAGNTVVFSGVNISDPDKLESGGYWSKIHFEIIKLWGANIVRVPIHPVAWRERGEAEYLRLLDESVRWASELGLYLIFEWHSVGNLHSGVFQHPMYVTDLAETMRFWKTIAHRYAGVSTVAFYEVFNEPTRSGGKFGRVSWAEWKRINEDLISLIRAYDPSVVILVAGFDWAYELRNVAAEPIAGEGIGYVTHPYPQKAQEPLEEAWLRDFGFVADTYPVFATEIGYMAESDPGAHVPVVGDVTYGRRIIGFFREKGISWTAWCFDPDWPPQLISDWDYTPTAQGRFFKSVMQSSR